MTPNLVPMLDPDGNPGMVPHDRVPEAVQAGGKVGFHMQAPDGSLGVIPAERLHDAIAAGGSLYQGPRAEPESDPDPGFLHGLWESTLKPFFDEAKSQKDQMDAAPDFGDRMRVAVSSAMKNTPYAMGARMVAHAIQGAYHEGRASLGHTVAAGKAIGAGDAEQAGKESLSALGHGMAAALPVVGPAAAEAGEDIGQGRTGEGLGKATGLIGSVLAGGKTAEEGASAAEAMKMSEAAEKLTDAINPKAVDRPKMISDFQDTLAKVHHGEGTIHAVDLSQGGRKGLIKALEDSAEAHNQIYREQLLDPIKDKTVPGSYETYGEMESKLDHLNRMTNYQPTTAAESAAQIEMKAEAAKLRTALNENMAKEHGLQPEQVAEARKTGAQMMDLADKARLAVDEEAKAANARERAPITVNPLAKHERFVLDPLIQKGAEAARKKGFIKGDPDIAVNNVFRDLKTDKPQLAVPKASKPKGKPAVNEQQRKAVVGAGRDAKAPGSTSTIGENVELSKKYQAERALSRDRSAFDREAGKASKAAVQDVNNASHGKYKKPSQAAADAKARQAPADDALKAWPKEYRESPRNLGNAGGGGANYSAAELKEFKTKHGIK